MAPSPWLASRTKRAIDVALAGGALIVALPVYGVVAAAVRLTLGSPVLFHQVRAGRLGAPIDVYKFRTMSDARDASGALLPDAERLGRLGSFVRSASLDELPQLLTIIKGDMSIVGPRPLPERYIERYSPEQARRLLARPGLTGWAQATGRNSLTWPEKFAADVWYVENASLRVDLRIIGLTVKAVLRRQGIAADGQATMTEFMGER